MKTDIGRETNRFLKFAWDEAPVIGFQVLRNDVVAVRRARNPEMLAERLEGAIRGEIDWLSSRSRKRLALTAGNCGVSFRSFVTVTYPRSFPCDGRIVKRHLHGLLAGLRRKCPGCSYLWFLEFQRRGAPHLHVFLSSKLPDPLSTMKRAGGRVRKTCQTHLPWHDWLARLWYRIVGSKDERHLKAGTAWEVVEKPDGCARYVAKESYKTFQKQVPPDFSNVGRFWGTSRDVKLDEGRFVPCTPERMRLIFPAAAFDENGEPFPVMFSQASAYEKIRGTTKDPHRIRQWHNVKKGQNALISPTFGVTAKPWTDGFEPTSKRARKIHA